MRDPNRIPRILEKLKKIWEMYPDLRLGQIVENARSHVKVTDTFYVEDDKIEQGLDTLLKKASHGS